MIKGRVIVITFICLTIISCLAYTTISSSYSSPLVEIYAFDQNPAGYDSGKEWITLYNPSKNPVDIGGWKIKSTHGKTVTVEIPEGIILETGEEF